MDDFFRGVDEAVQTLNLGSTGESLAELLALSRELVSTLDATQALTALGEAVRHLVSGDRFVVLKRDSQGLLQSILARDDQKQDMPLPAKAVPMAACLKAMQDDAVAFVSAPQSSALWSQMPEVSALAGGGFLIIPLVLQKADGGGRNEIGCVYVDTVSPFTRILDSATLDVLYLLGQHAAITMENAQVLEQVAKDDSGEVQNAAYFERRLREEHGRTLRYRRPFSMVLIDVEGADTLVVKYGQVGLDDVIRQLAGAIRQECRDSDVVARLAPARFGILLPEMNALELAQEPQAPGIFGERLRKRIAESAIKVRNVPQSMQIIVGCVTYTQSPVVSAAAVMHEGEQAMEIARKNGRDHFIVR